MCSAFVLFLLEIKELIGFIIMLYLWTARNVFILIVIDDQLLLNDNSVILITFCSNVLFKFKYRILWDVLFYLFNGYSLAYLIILGLVCLVVGIWSYVSLILTKLVNVPLDSSCFDLRWWGIFNLLRNKSWRYHFRVVLRLLGWLYSLKTLCSLAVGLRRTLITRHLNGFRSYYILITIYFILFHF